MEVPFGVIHTWYQWPVTCKKTINNPFVPFSPVSAWSKKLPNFAVKHVDLSWDFGHDVPCMGRRIDISNAGGLDIRPIWQIEPGVFLP